MCGQGWKVWFLQRICIKTLGFGSLFILLMLFIVAKFNVLYPQISMLCVFLVSVIIDTKL